MTPETTTELTKLLKQWRLSDEDGPLSDDGISDLVDDIEHTVNRQVALMLHDLADGMTR